MKKESLAGKGPGKKKGGVDEVGAVRKKSVKKVEEKGDERKEGVEDNFSFSRALLSLRNLVWQGKYEELDRLKEEYSENGLEFMFIRETMQLHYQYEEEGEKVIRVEYLGKKDELGGVFG